MLTALLGVLAVVALTFGTALYVAAEFSLVAVERTQLEAAARDGDHGAQRVLAMVRTLSFQLSGAQLGITLTTLVVGFIAEPSFSRVVAPLLDAVSLPEAAVTPVSLVFALAAATVLQMVIGELVPKSLAISRPLEVARAVAGPHRVSTTLLRPLIAVSNGSANRVVRMLGIEPQEELRSARTPAELGSLVRSSQEQGALSERTASMLARSLTFGDRNAGDVLTSRTQIVSLPRSATVDEVLALAQSSGHSRFPIEGESVDDVVGVVHVKQALGVPRADRSRTRVGSVMGPVPRVPEALHLDRLLVTLRQPGLQMAVVVDEYGGTAGLVTLEDLVEELVGEVDDEHDLASRPSVEQRRSGLVLSGLLRDDEVDEVGLPMPRGPYDTLGGLVMARLGRVPRTGDVVDLDDWRLTVTEMDGRRVDRVLAEQVGEHPDDAAPVPAGPAGPPAGEVRP